MATSNHMGLMAADKSSESALWFQHLILKECLEFLTLFKSLKLTF